MKITSHNNFHVFTQQIRICLLLSFLYSDAKCQETFKPAICNPPTATAPTPVLAVPVSNAVLPIGAIDVRLYGAYGDGQHEDGSIIQSVINSNPTGTIYLPTGLYRLNNASLNVAGLIFQNFHGTFFMQNGARLLCDNATTSAGQCVHIVSSSNATFNNVEVGYRNDQGLPMGRNQATNNGILVELSSDITLAHTTIESSPGSGIWVANSSNVRLSGGTRVSNTTADGLHFENDANSSVVGYTAGNTGDDALAATNIATANPKCGLTASNIRINNSHSRGIAVAGACTASFSDFAIDMSANSGIGIQRDPDLGSRVPTDIHFENGVVSNAGKYPTTISGLKDCIDISDGANNSSVNGVTCSEPQGDGVFLFSTPDHILISGVAVNHAGNVGFQAVNSSNVTFTNDVSRDATTLGYSLQQVDAATFANDTSCSDTSYGFYHTASNAVTESNLVSYDSGTGQANGRVWWTEDTGSIALQGMIVNDDTARNATIVVGGAQMEGVSLQDVVGNVTSGRLVVTP